MKPAHLTALAMTLLVRLWIDGVLVDADFLDYNTLGTNLKVWGDDAGGLTVDGAVAYITDTPSPTWMIINFRSFRRVMPRFGKTIG